MNEDGGRGRKRLQSRTPQADASSTALAFATGGVYGKVQLTRRIDTGALHCTRSVGKLQHISVKEVLGPFHTINPPKWDPQFTSTERQMSVYAHLPPIWKPEENSYPFIWVDRRSYRVAVT